MPDLLDVHPPAGARQIYRPDGDGTWQHELGHVKLVRLSPGDAGIYETVEVMRDLLVTGVLLDDGAWVPPAAFDPYVRQHAEGIVRGVLSGDHLAELLAVRDWIAPRVVYRRDPAAVEWLQAPAWMLWQIDRGVRPSVDCDDLTLLSLSLLGALGFPTRIVVVSRLASREFNHVYGAVKLREADAAWVRLDLTDSWRQPGALRETETRVYERDV